MSKKKNAAYLGLVLCGLALTATRVVAAGEAKPAGVVGEMLASIGDAEGKLGQLVDAIPEAKFSWRPSADVRSTAEVFMHVAGANYGIPSFFGIKPPQGFDFDTYEKSLTTKKEIKAALSQSFATLKKNLTAASAEDLEKPVEMFGMKLTVRAAYLLLVTHAHEHLGQMIAYARMNGVVPPWTTKQKESEAAKAKPMK
jgi:uncharacterized damage-inducible protein DinB